MFSKKDRLYRKKDIENVFKNGKSFREKNLVLKIIDNNLKDNRFGFSVSKKVSKKAVLRNKIKRRVVGLLEKKIKKIKKGKDCLFIFLPGSEKNNLLETEKILNQLLKKTGLL